MFRRVSKHINPATILALVALVFAATGGAYAASGGGGNGGSHATASAAKKKKKPAPKPVRGPAGPKGATGAAGPAGPAGPAGAKGENGAAGTNGTNGTGTPGEPGKAGESVTSATLNPHEEGCEEGGSKFTVGGKTTTACNGEPAAGGGFPETLPEEKTETGAWAIFASEIHEHYAHAPISFAIPLPAASSKAFFLQRSRNQRNRRWDERPRQRMHGNFGETKGASRHALRVYSGPRNLRSEL